MCFLFPENPLLTITTSSPPQHELQKVTLHPPAHLHSPRNAKHRANIRRPRVACIQAAQKVVEEKV